MKILLVRCKYRFSSLVKYLEQAFRSKELGHSWRTLQIGMERKGFLHCPARPRETLREFVEQGLCPFVEAYPLSGLPKNFQHASRWPKTEKT